MSELVLPHGDVLSVLHLSKQEVVSEKEKALRYLSWDLTQRQLCDLELLLNGGFSPLKGFMTKSNYESVKESMRLENGLLWPIPITLDVSESFARNLKESDRIALRDPEGVLIAVLLLEEIWQPDLKKEAKAIFGTLDEKHPGVAHLLHRTHPYYLGGKLLGIEAPMHYDFKHLRDTPTSLREKFKNLGWTRVVAFQTRTPCIAPTRN